MSETDLAQTLLHRLEAGSSPSAMAALEACRRICRQQGVSLYLVGGTVRDLMLDRRGYDLDLTIEAEVAPIARELAEAAAGRAVTHARFGTAKVTGKNFQLDLAGARREVYPHPGSLPVVEPATLTEDLARRDFTINAVALRLEPGEPEVVDPYRGVADVRSSLLRVLHERSFQDDATRMLRALRYAARLGFKVSTGTAALVRRDLGYLGTISGPRLRRDLALLFEEPAAVNGVLLGQELGILEAIHPALRLGKEVAWRWRAALGGPHYASLAALGFCVLSAPRDDGTVASLSRWLHLSGHLEEALTDLVRLQSQSPKLEDMQQTPSQATEMLDRYAPASIWAHAVIEGGAKAEVCAQYLSTWRNVRTALTGKDLLAMGHPAGPALGQTLKRLRSARLDGRIHTREEEAAMVRGLS